MGQRKEKAFIIKNKRYKESDKLVTFFGLNKGKFRALAKGAQRPEVRKTGNLETGLIVDLSLIEGYQIEIITEVAPVLYPSSKRKVSKIILYISELVDKYTVEYDPDELLFNRLESILKKTKMEENLFYHVNELHLQFLSRAGYLPDFSKCAITGVDIDKFDKAYLTESGPINPNQQNVLPTSPLINTKYFKALFLHHSLEFKTNEKFEKSIFKILNYITEKTLDKKVISKNLFTD